jgi:hypothetical protein
MFCVLLLLPRTMHAACRSFECPKSFRVFGAQNPFSQGGGRKGLPKSFLNRFTKVRAVACWAHAWCPLHTLI